MKMQPFEKWPSRMTDRERFLNQLHGKSVDRSFHMEFGYWDENYEQWDLFLDNGIKNEQQANTFFAFDRMESLGFRVFMDPPFENRVVEETETTKIIINSEGLLAEVPKDSHETIPHYLKASVTTPEDWKKVKAERFQRNSPGRRIDLASLQAKYGDYSKRDYPLGIDCGSMIGKIRDMLTFEGLCYTFYDYPEMLEDMIETCCVLVEDMLDQVLPLVKFDFASGWEDICFKNGPILSVDYFEKVIGPRYQRIHRKLEQHGIDLWYMDCDGDVRSILPIFLDNGINCLFPFEVNCCTHPGKLLDQYEGRLRIMGGVDKLQLRAGQRETKEYLETLAPYVERGYYIPFCDHRCPPDVTPENYLYYLDLKKKMFG